MQTDFTFRFALLLMNMSLIL